MHPGGSLCSLFRSAWSVLACGLIVSFSLFFWVYQLEQRHEQARFERRALFQSAVVQRGMDNAIEALEDINLLFVTNGSVSRAQFHTFTKALRARHPYIEAFVFNRLVSHADRLAFEAQMRHRYPGFVIASWIDGKRVVADVKEHYSVIDYIEPIVHAKFIGLDTSTFPFQDDVVRRATDTGRPAATALFRFLHSESMYLGVRILMPVYRDGTVPEEGASHRRAVIGYTVMLLRINGLIEQILASAGASDHAGLDMYVYAAGSPDESQLIYDTKSEPPGQARPVWLRWNELEPISQSFDVAGTHWHMVTTGQAEPFMTSHDGALFTLFTGLLTTLAVTAYLQAAALRERRIQQVVAERTEQLQHVNSLLSEDIAMRTQVEQALVRSEERARELAELASDWLWEQDEQFRFTSFSMGVREKGKPPPLTLGMTRWGSDVDPDSADWSAHRATLEAHQPFMNFEYKRQVDGMPAQWFVSSGKPLFDADGNFKGYRGTARDITDRKQAEKALRRSQSELRQLAAHQERIKEDERKRIAREIHDELGQNLMAIRLDVTNMAACADSAAISKEQIEAALRQIDATIKGVRAIINDLRPAVLDLGLHAAVEWQAKEFERRSGIACEVHIDHAEFALDEQCATALFRSVQESLTNIIRHAQASQVWIDMQRTDGRLFLKIADNGVGADPNYRRKAKVFGLNGIEERVQGLGGTFCATSEPGKGMTIELSIPI
jgi:PAS domain S-box-containing protein